MRFERARRLMAEGGLGGLVATSYESVAHLSGATIMTQRFIPDRLAAVILPLEGDPTLVVCTVEEAQARRESRVRDIRAYVEFTESPIETIAGVIRERGLARARVGVEAKVLSMQHYQEISEFLEHALFESCDDLLGRLRMVKSEDEIELLGRAALSTDAAIRAAYDEAGVGTTDKEIADSIAIGIQRRGADSVAFLVLGAGPTASEAHPVALDRPLEPGDVVRCDVGGHYSGYYSDLARTAVVGAPTSAHRDLYERLWTIHEETISQAQPGIEAKELYFACEKAFKKCGMQLSLSHIGHSLGLGLHDAPILSPYDTTVLEEGMVLAIEPVHKDGGPIFHVEDLVVIAGDGPQILSRSSDWSELPVIGG
jgi:Xaa-Pro dipeptidase